jgi:penicillin amidase
MTRRAGIITGVLAAAGFLALVLFFFLRHQVTKSFPVTSGVAVLPALANQVEVRRDPFGVPLITAANEQDLLAALGYVHAQDRLWQMDLGRRAGEGRLSEIFGENTVAIDNMFRTIGIRRIAASVETMVSDSSRMRMQWYADGVNAYIESARGNFPLEFDFLRYDPEPWTVLNCLTIAQMMAWELNLSWWTDLTLGAVVLKVDDARAADILPGFPESVPPIVPGRRRSPMASLGHDLLEVSRDYMNLMGYQGVGGGSNAWVVSPDKSASGRVILANDTHLHLQLPSKWFEVFLRSPDYELGGMSIPGVPGIVAGHNAEIAWGVTNMMADESDFYLIRVDSTDSTKYWFDGKLREMEFRTEEIRVEGGSTVEVVIRSTHHGPIVSDIRTPVQRAAPPFVAAMRWTGAVPADRVEAFHRINKARNWSEFLDGVGMFPGPGQNFVYGDKEGNIGYSPGGMIPVRVKGLSILPLPGWESGSEWRGFVPFEKFPRLYNPPEGYIATANNKITDSQFPWHISDLWEPPSRIQRLREVLSQEYGFSVHDFGKLQTDAFSHHAKEMVPHLLAAMEDTLLGFAEQERVKEYLANWDYTFGKDDIATALYETIFVRLLHNIYGDEMGPDLLHDFVILGNIPIRITQRLVEEGNSPWFDDISTPAPDSARAVICRSIVEAAAALRDRFGADTKTWRWGELHQLTLTHPFGLVKPLDRVFNIGPFPMGGGATSLMSGEYSFNEPFAVTVAGSFRIVYDFGSPSEIRSVLPSGQSGQAFHDHYSDQTQLWLNGVYRTFRSDSGAVPPGWEQLILRPR